MWYIFNVVNALLTKMDIFQNKNIIEIKKRNSLRIFLRKWEPIE